MENTPTPYQRQRRASREVPAAQPAQQQPIQQPLMQQPLMQQPMQQQPVQQQPVQQQPVQQQPGQQQPANPAPQQAVPRTPSRPARISYNAAQRSTATPRQQHYPPRPQAGQQGFPQMNLTPTPPVQPAGNRAPRSLQQRPTASSGWSMPTQQAPAGRPYAAMNAPRTAAPDRRERRRTAQEPQPRQRSDAWMEDAQTLPSPAPAAKRKTPGWLLTALSVMLVGVMALVAADWLMQAYLKKAADERQAAYESILFNYHVTEQADGSLRVTWQDLIEKYAEQYNLEPAFVTAVIRNESSFRTNAESSVGARGLMQMMPDTAEWIAGKLNDRYDFDRLYDAETSIRYGCWYLNYLSELFRGDPVLVCAAYHAGQGEVWGWLGDPAISSDGVTVPIENIPISNTKTYTGRVTQAYGIYQTLLYPQSAQGASADAVSHDRSAAADLLAAAGR